MKANNHLDETSAKILLERALIKDENGNYKFSRDLNVKNTVIIIYFQLNECKRKSYNKQHFYSNL
jgi:hypothetical protein